MIVHAVPDEAMEEAARLTEEFREAFDSAVEVLKVAEQPPTSPLPVEKQPVEEIDPFLGVRKSFMGIRRAIVIGALVDRSGGPQGNMTMRERLKLFHSR